MSGKSNPEESKVRYILGTLSEEEKARLEETYFVDDAEFEQFEIAEEELIDRYVRGELSPQETERLETVLAKSPRLIDRVQFARMMAERLVPEPARVAVEERRPVFEKPPWWQGLFGISTGSRAPALALSFSVLLLLIGGATLLTAYLSVREQSRLLAAQQAALEQRQRELDKQAADLKALNEELARGVQLPSPSPVPSQEPTPQVASILALTLSAGATRSGGGISRRLTPETSELKLTLNLPDIDYQSYRATLFNADRHEVFSKTVTRRGSVLILSVPAKQLVPGDYYVSVHGVTPSGTESVADYPFRLTK